MISYFSEEELACGCKRPQCDAVPMDMDFMFAVNGLRLEFGLPMPVTSACRCKFWNSHEGGEVRSWHLVGKAIDIFCPDGVYMLKLALLAIKHGFRIGVKKRMLHLDKGDGPQVLFGYS